MHKSTKCWSSHVLGFCLKGLFNQNLTVMLMVKPSGLYSSMSRSSSKYFFIFNVLDVVLVPKIELELSLSGSSVFLQVLPPPPFWTPNSINKGWSEQIDVLLNSTSVLIFHHNIQNTHVPISHAYAGSGTKRGPPLIILALRRYIWGDMVLLIARTQAA